MLEIYDKEREISSRGARRNEEAFRGVECRREKIQAASRNEEGS